MNPSKANSTSHFLAPVLFVHQGSEAIQFYADAFGAKESYRLTDPRSGLIGHAELWIQENRILISEIQQPTHSTGEPGAGSRIQLCLMVADVDAAADRAIRAGASVTRAPADHFHGHRCANLRDPFGHEWMLACEFEKLTPAEMQLRWNARPS